MTKHTGLCSRPTAGGNRGHGHFLLHLPLLQGRQSIVLAAGEGGGGVELGKPVEEEGHGEKKGPIRDRARTARRSLSRGCRRSEDAERGREMWINCVFFQCEKVASHPVIQSSQHHGTGSTKKPMLPRQNRAEDHWGARKKIRDSPFKLFGRRSEAGVLVAEQLLIVRVRLRDRPSALMDWPDWLERAVLVLGEPGNDSAAGRPKLSKQTTSPRGGGAGAAPASQLRNLGSGPCRRALRPITYRALTR